jgi:hypothetical protein
MPVTVEEIVVADPPELWTELGFTVEGAACHVGSVRVRLDPGAGKRVAGWSLAGAVGTELDGLATTLAEPRERPAADVPRDGSAADDAVADTHPNGVFAIDHVVAFTPDLDRTVGALEAAGLDLRRIREEPTPAGAPRQAFFRLGEVILECVQMPDGPELDRSRNAHLWGLALRTRDMEATAAALGDRLGAPRDAVQEGRQIATLRREAGSTVPIAFMTPP